MFVWTLRFGSSPGSVMVRIPCCSAIRIPCASAAFGKISCLIWGESRTDKVTHLAGNPLRSKSSTDAQFLKIFIIILDISDLQSINGIRQFLQLPFQFFKPLVYGLCCWCHRNLLSHVVTDSTGSIHKAVSSYASIEILAA